MLYNHSIDLQNGGYPVKKQAMTLLLAAVLVLPLILSPVSVRIAQSRAESAGGSNR